MPICICRLSCRAAPGRVRSTHANDHHGCTRHPAGMPLTAMGRSAMLSCITACIIRAGQGCNHHYGPAWSASAPSCNRPWAPWLGNVPGKRQGCEPTSYPQSNPIQANPSQGLQPPPPPPLAFPACLGAAGAVGQSPQPSLPGCWVGLGDPCFLHMRLTTPPLYLRGNRLYIKIDDIGPCSLHMRHDMRCGRLWSMGYGPYGGGPARPPPPPPPPPPGGGGGASSLARLQGGRQHARKGGKAQRQLGGVACGPASGHTACSNHDFNHGSNHGFNHGCQDLHQSPTAKGGAH